MATKVKQIGRPQTGALVSFEQVGDWAYTYDDFGDFRATNARRGLRTRLKESRAAVEADVHSGRLQRRINGEWEDRIR